MITTNLAPTSREAILPSGETFDLVPPGIFNVVAGGRTRGVVVPEFCRIGILYSELSAICQQASRVENMQLALWQIDSSASYFLLSAAHVRIVRRVLTVVD